MQCCFVRYRSGAKLFQFSGGVLLVLGCFRASQRHRVSARSLKRSPGARYPDHPVLRVARRTSEHTQQLVCRVAKLATTTAFTGQRNDFF